MAKTINMCVRVDPELKAQAEIILEQLGMNMNGTINMFLTQIVREKRVPLNLSLNNERDVLPDIIISKQERESGIDGIDARKLLVSIAEKTFPDFVFTHFCCRFDAVMKTI